MSEPIQPSAPDRTPPHSGEAEEHVIACCLLDGSDTFSRCVEAKISAESFYLPQNRVLFETMDDMRREDVELSVEKLAEELKARRQLEAVGGFPYLMQVTGKIPTTAHAGFFIEKVREKHLLREVIKAATSAVERAYAFTGGMDEFLAGVQSSLGAVAECSEGAFEARPLTAFEVPRDDDPNTLLGNRYLCRGDGAMLVSTSGMGKSSLTLQAAAHWAIKRPFMGIQPQAELRSVVVQAEDSDGDIGEVWAGIKAGMKLTPEEVKKVQKNITIVSDSISRGATFLAKLRGIVRKHNPDIVWINPLMSFCDGDLSDAQDMGRFLREGLNRINAKKKFAYFIVHHTPKPPSADKKGSGEKKWNEIMYEGAGSADLTNWARAIMVLKACENEGEFNLFLAKRGKRAGAVMEIPQGAAVRVEATTVIPLKHSSGKLNIEGRSKPLPMIYWEPRTVVEEAEGEAGPEPKRQSADKVFAQANDVLKCFPASGDEPETFQSVLRLAREGRHMTSAILDKLRLNLMERGLIEQTDGYLYRRTEAGDQALDTI